MNLAPELKFATEVVESAGALTLTYYQRPLEVDIKDDGSAVTRADREAEHLMRRAILARYPDDSILGEELGETHGRPDRRWIIDPIDGTSAFIVGVAQYGTALGLEIEGRLVLGTIHFPALKETVAAARGNGCYWNDRRCQVSGRSLSEALLVTTDDRKLRRTLPGYRELAESVGTVRTWGDSFGAALVATGRADIWLDSGLDITDIGPLSPIIEEASGRLTDWTGSRATDGDTALITNGRIHDEVLAVLNATA